MITTSTRRRHEVRDEGGHLVAVIDQVIAPDAAAPSMIELAADIGGHAYRVRIFPEARAQARRAA